MCKYKICTVLEGLMWKIFGVKCVKLVAFCILQMFTSTDVDALRILEGSNKILRFLLH